MGLIMSMSSLKRKRQDSDVKKANLVQFIGTCFKPNFIYFY